MSVKYDKMTRRQFLVGAGGSFLVLPFLPSLLSKEALAQVTTNPRRLLVLTHDHNIMASQILNSSVATQTLPSGARMATISSLTSPLTNYLTHSTYTNHLKNSGLITVVRGLDCMTDQSGHGAFWLTGAMNASPSIPSIDSYMEASQSVYPTATSSGYLKKVIRCNEAACFRKVGTSVSRINELYTDDGNNGWNGARKFYQDMLGRFSSGNNPPPPPSNPAPTTDQLRRNILNDVFSAFQSARNNRRISNNDKYRLEEHMEAIHELQNSIVISEPPPPVVVPGQACTDPVSSSLANSAQSSYKDKMEVYMKLMRVALTCNLTKIGIIGFSGHAWYDIGNNGANFPASSTFPLHNGYFHNEGGFSVSTIESTFTYWLKWHMDKAAEYIIEPLRTMEDVQSNNGKSYLENMVIALLSEAGVHSDPGAHANLDYMPILFGNMGGIINSNRYVVFDGPTRLPYNCLLITLLQAMGVPASEYNAGSSNGQGFGQYVSSGAYYNKWASRFYSPITEIWNG